MADRVVAIADAFETLLSAVRSGRNDIAFGSAADGFDAAIGSPFPALRTCLWSRIGRPDLLGDVVAADRAAGAFEAESAGTMIAVHFLYPLVDDPNGRYIQELAGKLAGDFASLTLEALDPAIATGYARMLSDPHSNDDVDIRNLLWVSLWVKSRTGALRAVIDSKSAPALYKVSAAVSAASFGSHLITRPQLEAIARQLVEQADRHGPVLPPIVI